MKVEFTHYGAPVPYVRMNHRNIWTDAVQRYLKYKGDLADSLKVEFWDEISEVLKADEATKKQWRYTLSVNIYAVRDAGDLDNFIKTVLDAIQDAGLVWNDKRVDNFSNCWLMVDRQLPRVEFTLERRE